MGETKWQQYMTPKYLPSYMVSLVDVGSFTLVLCTGSFISIVLWNWKSKTHKQNQFTKTSSVKTDILYSDGV